MKQVEFLKHYSQQDTFYLSPKCLTGQIQVQKPTLAVAKIQKPDHT